MTSPDTARTGYPRPGGTDRTGDPLLTLDDDALTAVVQIIWNAICLTGVMSAPVGMAYAQRRHHPRPGDLVLIIDTAGRGDADYRRKGWGYLLSATREPALTDAEWAESADQWDQQMPFERVFYVQYGPNPQDVCRWENAEAYCLPHTTSAAADIHEQAKGYL